MSRDCEHSGYLSIVTNKEVLANANKFQRGYRN